MVKRVTVRFTVAQADALRWMANDGLASLSDNLVPMHHRTTEAARSAIVKIILAMGLEAYRNEGQVFGRRSTKKTKH